MLDAKPLRYRNREIDPLTNSLASVVRWRYGDYASFLSTEFEMLSAELLFTETPTNDRRRVGAYGDPTN